MAVVARSGFGKTIKRVTRVERLMPSFLITWEIFAMLNPLLQPSVVGELVRKMVQEPGLQSFREGTT